MESYTCFVIDEEHCLKGADVGVSCSTNAGIISAYKDWFESETNAPDVDMIIITILTFARTVRIGFMPKMMEKYKTITVEFLITDYLTVYPLNS